MYMNKVLLLHKFCKTYGIGAVTQISSCRVNTKSRWGIKQLGISFDSIFPLFSHKSSLGATFLAAKGNPWSQPVNDSPGYAVVMQQVQLL